MKKSIFRDILLIFFFLPTTTWAQIAIKPDCTAMLERGDSLMQQKDPPLQVVLKEYLNAINCDAKLTKEVGPKIQRVFKLIEKQKKISDSNQRKAQLKQREAEVAQRNAEQKTKEALANDLAFKASLELNEGDRSLAFALAKFAHQYIDRDNLEAYKVLQSAYYYNNGLDENDYLHWHGLIPTNSQVLAISEDNKLIAGIAEGNVVGVWELATGGLVQLFNQSGALNALAFSPDGAFLASGAGNYINIWNLKTGEKEKQIFQSGNIYGLEFSPDGRYLASLNYKSSVVLWSTNDWTKIHEFKEHKTSILEVAFSSDNKYLCTASASKAVLFDLATKQALKTFEIKSDKRTEVSMAAGKLALSDGNKIKIWKLDSLTFTRSIERGPQIVKHLSLSPNGKHLYWSPKEEGIYKVFINGFNNNIQKLGGNETSTQALSISSDQSYIASAATSGYLKVWPFGTGESVWALEGHDDEVSGLAFSPDGKYLASGGDKDTVIIREIPSTKVLWKFVAHKDRVTGVSFSPNGKYLVTVSSDYSAKIWDLSSRSLLQTFTEHKGIIFDVQFSPNSKYFATASADKTIKLWSPSMSSSLKTLSKHKKGVIGVSFSPDSRRLVSGSIDKTAIIWRIPQGDSLNTFQFNNGEDFLRLDFSQDGKFVATGSSIGIAKLYDAQTGKELSTTLAHDEEPVNGIQITPDDRYFATASGDGTAKLWELSRGDLVSTFKTEDGPENLCMTISPDGQYLVTGGENDNFDYNSNTIHPVKIWHIKSDGLIQSMQDTFKQLGLPPYVFSPEIIREYRLERSLEAKEKWDLFLKQEAPVQMKALGNFYQSEIENINNSDLFSPLYEKAILCYETAWRKSQNDHYFIDIVKAKANWIKKLSIHKESEAANRKMEALNTFLSQHENLQKQFRPFFRSALDKMEEALEENSLE